MLQLCSYETVALGYSVFCGLFSEEDFVNYEYYYDLVRIADSQTLFALSSVSQLDT